ncbi:hypothetical protein BKK81_17800 [Cupriavidus sp. USMAHM13]|nr:hypothetical protein BKK81_17800 [Cupriavidus sp. USMAHM13]
MLYILRNRLAQFMMHFDEVCDRVPFRAAHTCIFLEELVLEQAKSVRIVEPSTRDTHVCLLFGVYEVNMPDVLGGYDVVHLKTFAVGIEQRLGLGRRVLQ